MACQAFLCSIFVSYQIAFCYALCMDIYSHNRMAVLNGGGGGGGEAKEYNILNLCLGPGDVKSMVGISLFAELIPNLELHEKMLEY